ncbi:MAG: hypothetical protein QXQ43_03705 [Nitrososphaerota archaeon]
MKNINNLDDIEVIIIMKGGMPKIIPYIGRLVAHSSVKISMSDYLKYKTVLARFPELTIIFRDKSEQRILSARSATIKAQQLIQNQNKNKQENSEVNKDKIETLYDNTTYENITEEGLKNVASENIDNLTTEKSKLLSINGIGNNTADKLLENHITYEKLVEMVKTEEGISQLRALLSPVILGKILKGLNE